MLGRIFCVFLLLTLQALPCGANVEDDFFFSHLGVEDGLSQISVLKIFQDSDGYLWFGTRNGLNRYDGYEFKIFRNEANNPNTLSDRYIHDINEDKNKNIWVATSNGLNGIAYLSGQTQRFYPMEIDSTITTNSIDFLFKHRDGNLYMLLGTHVFRCNPDFSVQPHARLDLVHGSLSALAQDPVSGDIYIGTKSKELFVYSDNWEFKERLDTKSGWFSNSQVTAVLIEPEGIWLGTEADGVGYMDKSTGEITVFNTANSRLGNNTIRSVIAMDREAILIGTFGGLNVLNKKEGSIKQVSIRVESQGGLSHYSIHSMLIDKDQTLWVGTYSAGINYHSPYYKQITYITPVMYTGIMGKGVQDKQGRRWFATEGRGLFCFDPITREQNVYPIIPIDHSNYERNIIKYVLLPEGSDEILCTTHFGAVYAFSISTKKYRLLYDYKENDIYSLYIDRHKRFWIPLMTGPGLVVVENGQIQDRFPMNGRVGSLSRISVINEVRDDLFLLGGYRDSLYLYDWDKQTIRNLTHDLPLSIQHEKLGTISSIVCDSAFIWVSTTQQGILKFDQDFRFVKHYQSDDGLSDPFITSMVMDNKGRIWAATGSELFGLNKQVDLFFPMKQTDVPKLEFTLHAGTSTSDGMIYFPASNGVLAFNPEKLQDNPIIPPLHITSILTNDNTDLLSQITRDSDDPQRLSIELKADQNNLAIRYAALNYIHSAGNQYKFRMDGVDDNWHSVGNRREAYYSNLYPGSYVFRVKSSNNDGLWNPEETILAITVLPPWYKTWWAYTFYALVILLIGYQIVRYQHRKLELERDIRYREKEQKRMKELHEERLRLFNNFAHELRTPLTLIINPLEEVLQHISFSTEIRQTLNRMKKNTQRMLTLVNNLMDVQRYEAGQSKLDKNRFNISALVNEIAESFRPLAERRQIRFEVVQALPDPYYVSYDETEIEKVVFNLLTNAFKFTPELGTVTLYLRRAKQEELNGVDSTESYLYLEVKDTGVGFSEEEKGKIFEPFYSFKNDLHQSIQGTGIGLHLSRSIVKLHGGHIFAESQPHEGSRFIVLLPDTEKQDETSDSATGTAVSETVEKTKLLLEEVDSRKKPTVLIVDDDAEICDYLTGQLGKDYHVFTAKNGREAFFKIGEVHPQLIVSDVVMPEMNGVELCRKIKETPETAHLPVILLTAKSAVSQIEEGLNTGADDYITKPFNISLLKARIRNILSSVNKKSEFNSSSDILRALGLHADAGKDDFLIQYIDIVKENIANPELDITYIYNRLGMSRANFYRKVKNLTGLSPIDLIRNIRVEFGAHLLKNTDLNISEIAQQTGFNSRSYFAKSFKTVYGITPTEYLKREKGRN